MTKKQLRLYVKLNFLVLFLFVVIFLIYYFRKSDKPVQFIESLESPKRSATVLPKK